MTTTMTSSNNRKTLVIGWFSFEWMGATAGDFIAADVLRAWLTEAGEDHDLAVFRAAGPGQVETANADPAAYTDVLFVCGPIGNGPPLNDYLDRFPHARKWALNVTLLHERADWNPFVHVVERDSSERAFADLTFATPNAARPVVGVIYLDHQPEYKGVKHDVVEQIVADALKGRDVATVQIDTQLDPANKWGLTSPAQIESVIAKMDAVITTRLHGAALSLRRRVPPVVIDSVSGGAKLTRQMKRVGWPLTFSVDDLTPAKIADALSFALTPEARKLADECARRAAADVAAAKQEFMTEFLRNRA